MIIITFIVVFFFGVIFAAIGDLINMSVQFSIIYVGSIIAAYCREIIDNLDYNKNSEK